jgi:hypothetical protein
MGIPILQTTQIGAYVVRQRLAGRKRFPLVLMLEPLFRHTHQARFRRPHRRVAWLGLRRAYAGSLAPLMGLPDQGCAYRRLRRSVRGRRCQLSLQGTKSSA